MKTIKLVNKGHFNFNNLVTSNKMGANKCGPETNTVFRYEVEIKASPQILQDDGFIMDVNRIDAYFQKAYAKNKLKVTFSCEEIANLSLEGLLKDMRKCKEFITYLRVRIQPTEYSYFEAEWNNLEVMII